MAKYKVTDEALFRILGDDQHSYGEELILTKGAFMEMYARWIEHKEPEAWKKKDSGYVMKYLDPEHYTEFCVECMQPCKPTHFLPELGGHLCFDCYHHHLTRLRKEVYDNDSHSNSLTRPD